MGVKWHGRAFARDPVPSIPSVVAAEVGIVAPSVVSGEAGIVAPSVVSAEVGIVAPSVVSAEVGIVTPSVIPAHAGIVPPLRHSCESRNPGGRARLGGGRGMRVGGLVVPSVVSAEAGIVPPSVIPAKAGIQAAPSGMQ